MKQQEIEKTKDYKYGFTTDIESIRAPKGLNEEVIKFISKIKKEPKWMLDWRMKAFNRLKNIKEPNWQKPKYPKINYQNLYYYSAPKSAKDKPKSLDEVDPKLIETYKKLGIPLKEQEKLAGVAVDEKVKTVQCNKDSKKGCNNKVTKCITHNLWDELENHINGFFEKKSLEDLLNNNSEHRN